MLGHGMLMAAGGGGISYKDLILADGPAALWMLDDTAGTTCVESVAGLNATLSGTYALAQAAPAGIGGKSIAFQSSAKAVTAATTTMDAGTLTAEFWFNSTSTNTGNFLAYGTSNYLRFQIGTVISTIFSNQNKLSSSTIPSDNAWHHGVCVVSNTGLKTYIDGAFAGSNTYAYPSQAASNSIYLGVGNSSEYFVGNLAAIAIYKKELTAAQVLAHYNAGK